MHLCTKYCTKYLVCLTSMFFAGATLAADDAVVISRPPENPKAVCSAAEDLLAGLKKVFPNDSFVFGDQAGAARRIEILVDGRGTPESFRIEKTPDGKSVRILGADPLGAVYGIYRLLEYYGCGFFLTYDTFPAPRRESWTPPQHDIADAPLVRERYSFNWHNFLSGCTGWDFEQWTRWIDQCRKLRYNVVMVHAYGNNPMFTFEFRGLKKPVGYLADTARGRDWGTPHVNDVRRMVGGENFSGPVFGAPPALVPPEQRIEAVQEMMKKVFAHARSQGMKVAFQLDVDTFSSNPEEMMALLPEDAKIQANAQGEMRPRPDTPEGRAYYTAVLETLLKLYPEIDILVVCTRTAPQPAGFTSDHFPEAWKKELAALPADPERGDAKTLAGYFWTGKVIRAFQDILKERKNDRVTVSQASWRFLPWIPYADACSPKEVALIPLDWCIVQDKAEFDEPAEVEWVRKFTASGRRIVPIIWSHHDDGHYLGRTYTPLPNFASQLEKAGCDAYGIIHWSLRPHGLYFKSHALQTWKATKDQDLEETCRRMARDLFGPEGETTGAAYLIDWVRHAPMFGRDTSNYMIDRPFSDEKMREVREGTERRLALLEKIRVSPDNEAASKHLVYWKGLEVFNLSFWKDEHALQQAVEALKKNDPTRAATLIAETDPRKTLDRYAAYAAQLGLIPGDRGLLTLMNLKWYPAFVGMHQLLGRERYRMDFAPTFFEPLAQSGGTRTFHIDRERKLWIVKGKQELKGEEWTWEANRPLRCDALNDSEKEIVRTGLVWTGPVSIPVVPVMHHRFAPSNPAARLPAEPRKLKLYVVDPGIERGEDGAFDLSLHALTPEASAYRFDPIPGARYLRINCRGNEANRWNSIVEIHTPSRLKDGLVKASGELKANKASMAFDGKKETRWAVEGNNHWLMFELDPNIPLEELRIDWYGKDRKYDFTLEISRDTEELRPHRMAWEPIGVHTNDGLKLGTVVPMPNEACVFEFDIPAAWNRSVFLRLEPKNGRASLCGLTLGP